MHAAELMNSVLIVNMDSHAVELLYYEMYGTLDFFFLR